MKNMLPFNIHTFPIQLPHTLTAEDWFHNDHPLDLELGTGRPHFFYERAIAFPGRNIVGIEWKEEFVKSANKRIVLQQWQHARALHGHAWQLVPLLFAPESIEMVFVHFPDPWWKKRQQKRRLLNSLFLPILQNKLKLGGGIFLQTDVPELFLAYRQVFEEIPGFRMVEMTEEGAFELLKARSHREKKCLEQKLPIYRAFWVKTST